MNVMYRKAINKIGLCRGGACLYTATLWRDGKKLDPSAYIEALGAVKDLYQYFVAEVRGWQSRGGGAREGKQERHC